MQHYETTAVVVSASRHNIVLQPGNFSFPRRQPLRFQWVALLAYARVTQPPDQGWVSLDEVRRLPLWRDKTRHHAGTDIGRYIQQLVAGRYHLIETERPWRGPYRLRVQPAAIRFDIPLPEIARRLGLRETHPATSLQKLRHFTSAFSRGNALLFQGRLEPQSTKTRRGQLAARQVFAALAADRALKPDLRLLALLAEVRVLDRLGRRLAAIKALEDCARVALRVNDPVLRARVHLSNAWHRLRAGHHQPTEDELLQAASFATQGSDKDLIGSHADFTGMYLSNKGDYATALHELARGLEAHLISNNYDRVQASCANIGNCLHRAGHDHYDEADRWLALAGRIASLMHLGRDEAFAETIRAKIALERGDIRKYQRLITTAHNLAERAKNRISLADVHVIRAFYFQTLARHISTQNELRAAWQIYSQLYEFDSAARNRYLARKFPGIWEKVVGTCLSGA